MSKKKKKLFFLVSFIIVFLFLIIGLILYFVIPNKFTIEIIDKTNINISLKNGINKCFVYEKIKVDDNTKIIDKELKKDGFKKNDDIYEKSFTINKSCKVLYDNYKNDEDKLSLKGDKNITLEVNSEYKEEGTNKSSNKIQVINSVDSKKVGNTVIIYKLKNELYNKYAYRVVDVIDSTKPEIVLKGNELLTVYLNNKYNEPGYTATDNYDGDITDKVIVEGSVDTSKKGVYTLTYKVTDSSSNEITVQRKIEVKEKTFPAISTNEVEGVTYINGILIVNKTYGLPKDYNPGVNKTAYQALKQMQADASSIGLNLKLVSGFRSYQTQYNLYYNYVAKDGQAKADTYSARPGHSEHQTGLAFDVGSTKGSFANTYEATWLAQNCHLYGFIIRYPKGKTNITGYIYEPWHIRYLGVDIATKVKNSGLTLEEYLGIN